MRKARRMSQSVVEGLGSDTQWFSKFAADAYNLQKLKNLDAKVSPRINSDSESDP